jgi:hypothetical protein
LFEPRAIDIAAKPQLSQKRLIRQYDDESMADMKDDNIVRWTDA